MAHPPHTYADSANRILPFTAPFIHELHLHIILLLLPYPSQVGEITRDPTHRYRRRSLHNQNGSVPSRAFGLIPFKAR